MVTSLVGLGTRAIIKTVIPFSKQKRHYYTFRRAELTYDLSVGVHDTFMQVHMRLGILILILIRNSSEGGTSLFIYRTLMYSACKNVTKLLYCISKTCYPSIIYSNIQLSYLRILVCFVSEYPLDCIKIPFWIHDYLTTTKHDTCVAPLWSSINLLTRVSHTWDESSDTDWDQ